MDCLQHALGENRYLKQQEIPCIKTGSSVLSVDCCMFPVGPLFRKSTSRLSAVAWHNYLSKSPLETPNYMIVCSEVSHHGQRSGVRQRDSSSAALRCTMNHGHVTHALQRPRGAQQHNRAQAVEECRPLSPCGGPGPN